MRQFLVFTAIFLSTAASFAISWQQESEDFFRKAKSLPRGRTEVNFTASVRDVTHRYSSSGNLETLGKAFEQKTNSTDAELTRKYSIRLKQSQFTPSLVHGLTKKWTLGFRLPITREESSSSTQTASVSSDGGRTVFKNRIQAAAVFDQPESFESDERVQIGNMELISKYQLIGGTRATGLQLSFVQMMRFPSAETSPADLVINPFPEAEGYGLGAGILLDQYWSPRMRTGISLFHNLNFHDEVLLRSANGAASESDIRLSRDPGDETRVGHSLNTAFGKTYW